MIAKVMWSKSWPVTRNAVIGMVSRKGYNDPEKGGFRHEKLTRATANPCRQRMPQRRNFVGRETERPLVRPAIKRAKLAKPKATPIMETNPETPTIFSLESLGILSCRWPYGDPQEPGFGFCGRIKSVGSSYCPSCAARAYAPPKSHRRAA